MDLAPNPKISKLQNQGGNKPPLTLPFVRNKILQWADKYENQTGICITFPRPLCITSLVSNTNSSKTN